jgi:cardiolipin synthase
MNLYRLKIPNLLVIFAITFLTTSCLTSFSQRPKHMVRTIFNVSPKSTAPGTPKFEEVMSRLTKSKLIEGNFATPLFNGEQVFPKMIDLIKHSKEKICLEVYIFRNDSTGDIFQNELILSKQNQKTDIYVMIDDVGNDLGCRKILKPLKTENIQTKVFNPVLNWTLMHWNQRNHRKIFTVDGQFAIISGLNIGNEYNGDGVNGFRDTGVFLQGPIVQELDKSFFANWKQGGYGWFEKDLPIIGINSAKRGFDKGVLSLAGLYKEPIQKPSPKIEKAGEVKARLVTSKPDNFASHLEDMYLLAINSAKNKVYITTSYFVPTILLMRAIKNASKRGVDVRILLQGKTDQNFVRQYAINKYSQLLKSGVHLYEWHNSILHSKTIIVDGVWTSIGSCNMDGRSFFLNYEANIAITDQTFALLMENQFLLDLVNAEKVTKKYWEKRKWYNILAGIILAPVKGQF